MVMPITSGVEIGDYAGIVVRSDGIKDNYWGWICIQAKWVAALIKAGTGITAGLGLTSADDADGSTIALARLITSTTGDTAKGTILGWAPFGATSDIDSDLVPVSIGLLNVDEV